MKHDVGISLGIVPFVSTPLKGRFVVFSMFVVFYRLFKVRLVQVRIGDCPAGLEPPTGAKNKRKATLKIR